MPIANAEPSSHQSEVIKPQTKKIQNEKITDDFLPETKPAKHLPVVHTASNPPNTSKQDSLAAGKQIRPDQKSANDYRQALSNLQQGRVAEAQANLTLALEANPSNHEARQTLAALLLDNKRNDEAKAILVAGLDIAPEQNDFRMAIARLELESGDQAGALNTLEQGLSYAKSNADYQGFLATLLQRAERHEEAITHYMTALSLKSDSTSALIGLGISLQAVGKFENALEAFNRAQSSNALSPELSQFVNQQLKEINQHIINANSK
jgi:MSHA biogenesis protein MshN